MMQKLKIPLIALATVLVFLGASMVIVGNKSEVIAVYATDTTYDKHTLKIDVLDPIHDKIISERNVTLQYPLASENGLSVVYSPKTKLLYAKTKGTIVVTGMDTSGCPESGECFVSIESFSPEGTDTPIIAYKKDFNSSVVWDNLYADQSRIESYKDAPYFGLLDNHTRRYNEIEFLTVEDTSHMKDPMPTELSIRTNVEEKGGGITLKKGNITKNITLSGNGIQSVFYFVSPDKKSLYLTTNQYNRTEAPNAPGNPFQLGLEKIDVDTMTSSEVAKNIEPRVFSPNGKYLLGYWSAGAGATELVLFNTETHERKELKSLIKQGTSEAALPDDFQLLYWVK